MANIGHDADGQNWFRLVDLMCVISFNKFTWPPLDTKHSIVLYLYLFISSRNMLNAIDIKCIIETIHMSSKRYKHSVCYK